MGDRVSQYFENDNKIKSERKLISFEIFDKKITCYTDTGVFSKDRFDYGTRLLLENVKIKNTQGRILDLGCGYGVCGIVLKLMYSNSVIDMVDVNLRSLKLAKENLKLNNVSNNVFESDGYSNIEFKYDYIITNPPIRAGKKVIREFIFGSIERLTTDGELWFVMRKDHGVKSILKEMEDRFETEIITKSKGFYVVCAKVRKN